MSDNTNLLKETTEFLNKHGKVPADVMWVGIREPDYLAMLDLPSEPKKSMPYGKWSDFERFANFEYYNGYGGAEINMNLILVGKNWWLERGEYDGSEWWEFKTLPKKPKKTIPLRDTDLKDD